MGVGPGGGADAGLGVGVDIGLGGNCVACLEVGADESVIDATASMLFLQTILHPL